MRTARAHPPSGGTRPPSWQLLLWQLLFALAAAIAEVDQGRLSAQEPPTHWATAWQMPAQAASVRNDAPPMVQAREVGGATVRQVFVPALDGRALRLRLDNRFGADPVIIGRATVAVARAGSGADLRPETVRALRFGGSATTRIGPGEEVWSDPVETDVTAGSRMAVSLYLPRPTRASTWHRVAGTTNYVSSAGDHAGDAAGDAYVRTLRSTLWLDRVDVDADPRAVVVVAAGDSITDGLRATLDAQRRWPDRLGMRLRQSGFTQVAVVNAGISGNRLLSGSSCYGESLQARYAHDVLDVAEARVVVVLIGINDINFAAMPPPRAGIDCDAPHRAASAEQIEQGLSTLAAQAHARGIKVLAATVLPAALPPAREAIRRELNDRIRRSTAYDGLVDFDAVMRDPRATERLLRQDDSGDGVHPDDAGFEAMAAAVPLDRLLRLASVDRPR